MIYTLPEKLPAAASLNTVSEITGIPRRTLQYWVSTKRLPITPITEHSVVMTRTQIRALLSVLKESGREAILNGKLAE